MCPEQFTGICWSRHDFCNDYIFISDANITAFLNSAKFVPQFCVLSLGPWFFRGSGEVAGILCANGNRCVKKNGKEALNILSDRENCPEKMLFLKGVADCRANFLLSGVFVDMKRGRCVMEYAGSDG